MKDNAIKKVVILGGGSAGWLTAGVIAAEHKANQEDGLQVTLVESPDVSPIGVGEGTWPSMRSTLAKIGVSETELFRECEASFKQGAKFAKWVTGEEDDFYYHPLMLPLDFNQIDLVLPWQNMRNQVTFADAVCSQSHLCEKGLAPKQISTPEYASVANYAYHLNSAKLGEFLKRHCTEKLGVNHVLDHVTEVKSAENGDIAALATKQNGDIDGDFFIDCSGFKSLLLGEHFNVPFIPKKHILFNDAAVAVQAPYPEENSPIASHTISTAQKAGWIWDIGLPSRRGCGNVYSTSHTTDEAALEELKQYIEPSLGREKTESLSYRKIPINPGHRKEFWHKNCVAVGMAAGFLEPLEASALVLVESSASMISAEMPSSRDVMDICAKRFNKRLNYYWESIIDFLKLHYILTKRTDTDYWVDNLREETIPDRLTESLELWKHHVPNRYDFPLTEEMFPAASWQYVLYGMGFETTPRTTATRSYDNNMAQQYFQKNMSITKKYLSALPNNRDLISKIKEFGMQTI